MIASWFSPEWLIAPMRSALEYFVTLSGNYGLGIVLLTIAVRLVILPLTMYQMKSMKKMQEVQPMLKALQEKYKGKPEELNKEMMNLYKTQGVNPLSGCLPLLIQMPFLYAIFAVLQNFDPSVFNIDPHFLWISDLNTRDTLLAAITVISMVGQSWLTMVGNDPNQRLMMYLMPVMFGWISYQMAAGVVLYWVVSTIFGLIQQAIYPGFPRLKAASVKGDTAKR